MALKDEIGSFCWYALMTRDPAKATDFYRKALGWTTDEYQAPGIGENTIYVASGKPFAHAMPLEGAPDAVPSHWMSYLAVDDVDTACKRAEQQGGKVCIPAFDMPTIGRTAIVNDPVGAAFHLFTPENRDNPMSVIGNQPGQVCWMELMLDEPEKLFPFYSELLGWKIERTPMETAEYYSVQVGEEKVAGIMKRPPQAPQMPPAWMPYFAVTNIGEANNKVKSLGATLLMESVPIPETGIFSLMQDPTGAASFIFEWQGESAG